MSLLRLIAVTMPLAVAALGGAGAQEPPRIPGAALIDILDVYAEALVASRGAEAACGSAALAPDAAEGWRRGVESFVASMKANGLPAGGVSAIEARLRVEPEAPGLDCASDRAAGLLGFSAGRNWREAIETQFNALGLSFLRDPPPSDLMERIRAIGDREREPQARMLACLAVLEPAYFPANVADWAGLVRDVAAMMIAAGLPAGEVAAFADDLQPWSLWRRPTPAEAAELEKSCMADQAWMDRAGSFGSFAFKSDIEALIPPPAP